MRILKVTGGYPPASGEGGTATAAHALCKALRAVGADVSVLTTNSDGSRRLDIPRGWTSLEGVPVRYCRRRGTYPPYWSPELVRAARQIVGDYDVVLLDAAWVHYGVAVGDLCRGQEVPYVIYAHGSHAEPKYAGRRWRKRLWWKLLDRRLYAGAMAFVALTRREKSDLLSLGVSAPIKVIPNGVELGRSAAPRSRLEARWPALVRKRFLLFLGRIEPIKGLDLLVSAFRNFACREKDLVLVLAGPEEGGYGKVVRRAIEQHGLGGQTLFTGRVSGEVKWGLLKEACVLVLPSRSEGFSVAVLEALAVGTPAVVTSECNFPEIDDEKCGISVACNPDALVDGLDRVLNGPVPAEVLGRNGRALVRRNYSWGAVARSTHSLCEAIAGGLPVHGARV